MPWSFPARENKTGAFFSLGIRIFLLVLSDYPTLSNDSLESFRDRVRGGLGSIPRMIASNSRARTLWIALVAFALVGFGVFFFPAFIIRPFRYQNPRALLWAMAMRDRAPLISLLCAIICLVLVALLWRASSRWGRALLVVAAVPVLFSAVMSRLNYFEWMFHPVDTAKFESESTSKLGAAEMILAVRYGADARAYPIREMAYHHILNDVVGGVPIAVTY